MKTIKSIEIKNSPFFEDCKIEFSKNLNCIMGGRGTGKSTILYFLKSAIFKNIENDKEAYGILKSNLGAGEVYLEIESQDGSFYRITKTLNDEPQPYKHPSSEYFSIDKIFDNIECDFYETSKIEGIGRSAIDRLQLLDKKVSDDIRELQSQVVQLQIEIDSNSQDIKTFNLRLQRINESIIQYEGIEDDFQTHKNHQPEGLKDEEKKEFEEADIKEKSRKNEKRTLIKLIEFFKVLRSEFELKLNELNLTLDKSQTEVYINKQLMSEILEYIENDIEHVKRNIDSISSTINNLLSRLDSSLTQLSQQHDLQQAEFIQIKQQFDINREYINKYHLLSKRLNEKETLKKDKIELLEHRERLKIIRKTLIEKLNNLKQSIFEIRLKSINELNRHFDGAILINLTFSGITSPFEDKLREALKGSGLRYNELIPRIAKKLSCDEFACVIHNKDKEKLKVD